VQDIVEQVELEDTEGAPLRIRQSGDEAESGHARKHDGEAQGDLLRAVHRGLVPIAVNEITVRNTLATWRCGT
jgi:hypothetical protein